MIIYATGLKFIVQGRLVLVCLTRPAKDTEFRGDGGPKKGESIPCFLQADDFRRLFPLQQVLFCREGGANQ